MMIIMITSFLFLTTGGSMGTASRRRWPPGSTSDRPRAVPPRPAAVSSLSPGPLQQQQQQQQQRPTTTTTTTTTTSCSSSSSSSSSTTTSCSSSSSSSSSSNNGHSNNDNNNTAYNNSAVVIMIMERRRRRQAPRPDLGRPEWDPDTRGKQTDNNNKPTHL